MKLLVILFTIFPFIANYAQENGKALTPWKEGEMEIHHIYTGRGECVFCILPDGTTMLIDAGDVGAYRDPRTTHGSPDETRQPGEWISRYILNRLGSSKVKQIDYALLTHFHGDHMGTIDENSQKTTKGGSYYLNGLTQVAEAVPFKKIVDRDWPDYKYPKAQEGKTFENYLGFIDWNIKNTGMKAERFKPGSAEQFKLARSPEKYKDVFEIRNIVSNGEVWTGVGNETKKYFPNDLQGVSIDENKVSAGIRISYGPFNYFNGGDLTGRLSGNAAEWRDIETPVGKAVGPVEVCEVNHHAWIDAMNESFISSVRPQVFVMQVWHVTHMNLTVIQSMSSKALYPDERLIIPTNIPEVTKAYIGDENIKKLAGNGGHVVIKIEPGGEQYKVVLLDTKDESYTIKSVFGPFESR